VINQTARIEFNGESYDYIKFTGEEISEYKALRDMYYSDGGFKNGSYLIQFPREADDFFEKRKLYAHYENIFRTELDAKVSPIFAKPQIRSEVNPVVDQFTWNPTLRAGETMSEYQFRKSIHAKLFGAIFEFCDAPDVVPDSGAENLSVKEYAYYLTPLNIEGYLIDDTGALQMVVFYEDADTRDSILNGTQTTLRVFLRDYSGQYWSFRYDGAAINQKQLDYSPMRLVEDNTRYRDNRIAKSKYLGELSIVKTIYSLTSWYKDSFVKNCFAFLAVNQKLPQEGIDLGADSAFQYIGDGVNPPSYIAPPTEHLRTMMDEAIRLTMQVKQNMNSVVSIASAASGESRIQADRRRIEELKMDANNIADCEYWLVNTALRNYVDFTEEYTVIYPNDFESLTKSDELSGLQVLLDNMDVAPEVKKEVVSDMIKIVYSTDPERAATLSQMQLKSVPTYNTAFESENVDE
jgi:hypothetical protein